MQDGQLAISHNMYLFNWHVFDNVFPGEEADKNASCLILFFIRDNGLW